MVEQVADRDRLPVVRHLRNVLPDVVVERQMPLLRGKDDACGHELLRGGGDVEDAAGGDQDVVLQVRHPKPTPIDELSIADHTQRATGRVPPVPTGEQRIHSLARYARFGVLAPSGLGGLRDGGKAGGGEKVHNAATEHDGGSPFDCGPDRRRLPGPV